MSNVQRKSPRDRAHDGRVAPDKRKVKPASSAPARRRKTIVTPERALREQLTEYLQQLDPHIFAVNTLDGLTLTPFTEGLKNLNYLMTVADRRKRFALRAHPANTHGADKVAREYELLKSLQGMVAPRPIYLGKPAFINSSIMITQFIPGTHKNLAELKPHEIRLLAETMHLIHATTNPTFTAPNGRDQVVHGTYAAYFSSTIKATIRSRFQRVPESLISPAAPLIRAAYNEISRSLSDNTAAFAGHTFSLLHSDIGASNLIWHRGKLTVIDWEDAQYGDAADEVAYIFAVGNVGRQFEQTFLQSYAHDAAFGRRIPAYSLKNRLFDFAWSADRLHAAQSHPSPLLDMRVERYQTYYDVRLEALRQALEAAQRA